MSATQLLAERSKKGGRLNPIKAFPTHQVPEGFRSEERAYLESLNSEALILLSNGKGSVDSYEPMKTSLVAEFSKIANADDALAFANKYGFLGIPIAGATPHFQAFTPANDGLTVLHHPSVSPGLQDFEPVNLWLEQASAMRKLFNLWRSIQDRNVRSLRRIELELDLPWPGKFSEIRSVRQAHSFRTAVLNYDDCPPFEFDDVREHILGLKGRAPSGDLVSLAKMYLVQSLNWHLQPFGSATFVCLNSNGALSLHSRPVNLCAALWMQLSEIVTGIKKIRPCEICGELMDVTNHSKRKKVHDLCSKKERMRRYRKTL